jgi:hypothetical protein
MDGAGVMKVPVLPGSHYWVKKRKSSQLLAAFYEFGAMAW